MVPLPARIKNRALSAERFYDPGAGVRGLCEASQMQLRRFTS
jgi:hypothetical protein